MIDKSGKLKDTITESSGVSRQSGFQDVTRPSGFQDAKLYNNFNHSGPAALPGTYHSGTRYDSYDTSTVSAQKIWLNEAWVGCDIYGP